MASNDNKRQWMDDSSLATATTAPSRPPLKKRFTSNMSISSSAGPPTPTGAKIPLAESPIITTPVDNIDSDALSKSTLLQNMRNAKNDALRLESKTLDLENEALQSDALRGMFRAQWRMFHDDLVFTARSFMDMDEPNDNLPDESHMHKSDLQQWINNARAVTSATERKIVDYLHNWLTRVEKLNDEFLSKKGDTESEKTLTEWLRAEVDDLIKSNTRNELYLRTYNQKYQQLMDQKNIVLKQIQTASEELETATGTLYNYTEKIYQLERTLEKVESVSQDPDTKASLIESPKGRHSRETSVASTSSTPRQKNNSDTATDPPPNSQVTEHQMIVDARNKELEELKRDQTILNNDIGHIRTRLTQINYDRLEETDLFKNLQLVSEQDRQRITDLDMLYSKLKRSIDDVQRSQRQLGEEKESDKQKQNERIKLEMERLEKDTMRISVKRDEIKKRLKDGKEAKSNQENAYDAVLAEIDTDKTRMEQLKSQLRSLGKDVNSTLWPSADEVAACKELMDKLKHLKSMVACIQETQSMTSDKASLEKSRQARESQAQDMKQHILAWRDTETAKHGGKVQDLMKQLDESLQKADALQLLIEFYEENEKHLLKELEIVSNIYTNLGNEKRRVDEVEAALRKEADYLQATNAKYAEKFSGLARERDEQILKVSDLRNTRDEQNKLMAQLKNKEKLLGSQVGDKETVFQRLQRQIQDDRSRLETTTTLCKERENTLKRTETCIHELQRILKEKARALDVERTSHGRVLEEYEKMKKKWEMIAAGDNPQAQELATECEDLKSLLKCSTCRTHFRTHLIARCMHTFCKYCIDARLETRQRRCPSCGDPFGASDVKQFYL